MERLEFTPNFKPPKTEIYFGLDQLKQICQNKKGVIIAESQGSRIQKILGYELINIPNKKTREAKEALEDQLFKRKVGRDEVLIGVGGGQLTDLVGFTASTYMRGVELILIPTTLLAMVDAAIGGKTGIDTPFGKNLIGTFYLPQAIFIDVDFLKTLPQSEMKNGLSEILKYGLVADRPIWELAQKWEKHLSKLIRASILCKCRVVEADYQEKGGLRRILNFGHTVGHGLELISNYQMSHGEAVALGCMAESYLSHLLGYLSKESLEIILTVYRNFGYSYPKIDAEALKRAMSLDKKNRDGQIRFVLISEIGQPVPFEGQYCTSVSQKEIDQMISWMNHA